MANFWDDATGVLGKVAPMLATAVGGPLAGAATSAIISALGLAPDTSAQATAAAVIAANPDQLLALKKADQEFAEKMAQLNLDTEKLAFDDVANARGREVAVKDHTPSILMYLSITGAFAAAGAVLAGYVPDGSIQAGVVLGFLFGEAKQASNYFLGSSRSSDTQTNMIYQSTPVAKHK